uniref:Uncharacterized protein n=1 Tax=Plectus sambesii TaxID=2011161 RepID=A0A914VNJ2_9BILA
MNAALLMMIGAFFVTLQVVATADGAEVRAKRNATEDAIMVPALDPGSASFASFNLPTNIGSLTVSGTIHLFDDENWPDGDEFSDQNIDPQVFNINKFETFKRVEIADKCVGGEVRAVVNLEYWFSPTVSGVPPDTINVKVSVNLYEGGGCLTTDYEDYREDQRTLFPDQRQDMTIKVPGHGGGSATLKLSLSHEKNT